MGMGAGGRRQSLVEVQVGFGYPSFEQILKCTLSGQARNRNH